MKAWFRNHRVAILVAFLVGSVYVSHHFFLERLLASHGREYYPVVVEGNFDEGYYALRAAEAYRGDVVVGDINLYEYRESPAFLPMLNPQVMAWLGHVAGSLKRAFILSDFLFPALIFLLIYLLAYELFAVRSVSLIFATIFIFVPRFGLWPSGGAVNFFWQPAELYFSRFEYPNITFIFFVGALYALLRLLTRMERYAWLSSGLAFGLLFYTYFYDWMYFGVLLALLAAGFAFARDYRRVQSIVQVGMVGLIISVPYWLNLRELQALGSYSDLIARIGIEEGRMFRLAIVWKSYLRAALFGLLLWYLSKNWPRAKRLYAVSLLTPIFILLNIQLVTGFVPQPDHWNRTQFLAVSLAAFSILLLIFGRFGLLAYRRAVTIGAVAVVLVMLIVGFRSQNVVARENIKKFVLDREGQRAFLWLRQNTLPESVVVTLEPKINDEVILFTDNYIFVPNGLNTVASTAEIWQRAMITAALHGLSGSEFRAYVEESTLYLFADQYRNSEFNAYFLNIERQVPADILDEKVAEYERDFLGRPIRLPYRADYLLVDDLGFSLWELTKLGKKYKTVYNNGRITIYHLSSDPSLTLDCCTGL